MLLSIINLLYIFIQAYSVVVFVYVIVNFICILKRYGPEKFISKLRVSLLSLCAPLFNLIKKVLPEKYVNYVPLVAYIFLVLVNMILVRVVLVALI